MVLTNQPWAALFLMLIAGITDMLDGAIARYFHWQTTVGAYLDPLADKVLLVSVFVSLFFMGQVPLFIFIAAVFRDVLIVVGAILYELFTKQLEMQPSLVSKATTLMQIIYILLLLLHMATPIDTRWLSWVAWITFSLTCISGIHYLVSWTHKALGYEDALK